MPKKELERAVQAIMQANSFVLACHGKPDGDTLGSALAMAGALRHLGKEALVLSQDGVPELYSFLPEHETVATNTARRNFDAAVVCDVQEPLRAHLIEDVVKSAPVRIFIDHHPTPECEAESPGSPGKIVVCDPGAAATAEVVLEVVDALGVQVDQVMAEQLMAAIVTDTGSFRFTNVTPRTFETAARLASLGADASEIARVVYDTRSLTSAKMLGRALSSLETDASGKIAWAHITRDDFHELGATDEDTESIANFVRSVRGALMGILFRDLGDGIRVSLRSHDTADVSCVAQAFGGGGHKAAAGCTLKTRLEDAITLVVAEAVRCTAS